MGCEFICGIIPKTQYPTKSDVQRVLQENIEQALWDYGHSGYTGSLAEADGIEVTNRKFNSIEEAEDWLDDPNMNNAPKWGPIVVVQTDDEWVYGANCSS